MYQVNGEIFIFFKQGFCPKKQSIQHLRLWKCLKNVVHWLGGVWKLKHIRYIIMRCLGTVTSSGMPKESPSVVQVLVPATESPMMSGNAFFPTWCPMTAHRKWRPALTFQKRSQNHPFQSHPFQTEHQKFQTEIPNPRSDLPTVREKLSNGDKSINLCLSILRQQWFAILSAMENVIVSVERHEGFIKRWKVLFDLTEIYSAFAFQFTLPSNLLSVNLLLPSNSFIYFAFQFTQLLPYYKYFLFILDDLKYAKCEL